MLVGGGAAPDLPLDLAAGAGERAVLFAPARFAAAGAPPPQRQCQQQLRERTLLHLADRKPQTVATALGEAVVVAVVDAAVVAAAAAAAVAAAVTAAAFDVAGTAVVAAVVVVVAAAAAEPAAATHV